MIGNGKYSYDIGNTQYVVHKVNDLGLKLRELAKIGLNIKIILACILIAGR